MRKIKNLVSMIIAGAGLGILTSCASIDSTIDEEQKSFQEEPYSLDFKKEEIERREKNLLKCTSIEHLDSDIVDCLITTEEIRYKSEKDDYWQSPNETAERRTGDCDCMNLFLKLLFEKKGIKSEIRVGYFSIDSYIKDGDYHLWLEVDHAGEKYVSDATGPFFVNVNKINRYNYLVVKDPNIDLGAVDDFRKRSGLDWKINEGVSSYPDLEKLARKKYPGHHSFLDWVFFWNSFFRNSEQ
jgi:hypothetical protein